MKKRKRRRRCPYCGELFWPDPRTAWRQWACGKSSCQSARRRETQQRCRLKNACDSQARRYRKAMSEAKQGQTYQVRVGPGESFSKSSLWTEMAEDMDPSFRVIFQFYACLILGSLRDERLVQPSVNKEENGNYELASQKDERVVQHCVIT